MSTERDTHFQGFARLLWTAIVQSPEWPYISLSEEEIQQAETVIAQCAYDLVAHSIEHLHERMYNITGPERMKEFTLSSCMNEIPDLTEWPKPDS